MFGMGPTVSLFGVPKVALTHRVEYGTDGPIYEGWALSVPTIPARLTVVAATAAADTSFQVTGHKVEAGMLLHIRDATGEWAAINGFHNAKTITDVNNFTIEASSAGFTDPWNGIVDVVAPRVSDALWSILKRTYSTGNPVLEQWADGNSLADNIWDNRASLKYQ
jgi:hypothetical protein